MLKLWHVYTGHTLDNSGSDLLPLMIGSVWCNLRLGCKWLFVQLLLKCVMFMQLLACFRSSRSLPDLKSIPRWAASNGCPAIANEKCPHLDAVYFYSVCLLQQLYHRLSQDFSHAQLQVSRLTTLIYICLSTEVTFDHVSLCEISGLWNQYYKRHMCRLTRMINHELSSRVCIQTIIL